MPPMPGAFSYQIGHVSAEARLFTACCGLALFGWSLLKLRRRSALVPTCSLFLTIGLIFIFFSIAPNAFDRLSYALGVQYPPVLYLIGCVFALILMIVHLASRLSVIDERCRRLAQELALSQAGSYNSHGSTGCLLNNLSSNLNGSGSDHTMALKSG